MAFRGVNLGGWLVLERWITPDIFAGSSAQDEYSLCRELGPKQAHDRLEGHRSSFITRENIQELADRGFTVLRVPVGYWLFDAPEPFVSGSDRYIEQLFVWAEICGMQVILDVHAAPGSQNGWDHSGRAGDIHWAEQRNIGATLQFVEQLVDHYGNQPALYGIEVLNEPHWDISLDTLINYYLRSHQIIDSKCPLRVRVICSDSFRPDQMSQRLAAENLERVIVDVHLYQLFTPKDRVLDLGGHLKKAAGEWSELLSRLSVQMPVMVGEWSAAMDEQRHAYTNDDYKHYFKTQRAVFEDFAIGWTYWTARTQHGGPWSLLDHPEFLQN